MNVYIAGLVIFLTSLLTLLVAASLTASPTPEQEDEDYFWSMPLPLELPRAGYLSMPDAGWRFAYMQGPYGPFPADTGPLLILSEQAAAEVALQREIRVMIEQAEGKIPPRWRS